MTVTDLNNCLGFGETTTKMLTWKSTNVEKIKKVEKNPTTDSNSYAQLLIVMILEQFEV